MAEQPQADPTLVQADYDFFRDKQMKIIYPSSPGAFPIEQVAARLGERLGSTVSVEYVMQNGTVGGTNAGATSDNDGLTIGVTSIGGALAALLTGVNQFAVDFSTLAFLGAVGNSPSVLVSSRPDVTSIEQLVSRRQRTTFVAFPNSRQLISSVMLARLLQLDAEMLTSYQSSGQAAAACQRGEGDVAVIALDQILDEDNTHVAAGFNPLMLMGEVPDQSKALALSRTIPGIASVLAAHPLTTDDARRAQHVNHNFSDSSVPAVAFFLPPGTPSPRLIAVEEALRMAFADPELGQLLADKTVSSHLIPPLQISGWLRATSDADGSFITDSVSRYTTAP